MINQKSHLPTLCNKKSDAECQQMIQNKWQKALKHSQESSDDKDQNYKEWLTDEEAYFLYTMSDDTPMSFDEFLSTDQKGYWTAP